MNVRRMLGAMAVLGLAACTPAPTQSFGEMIDGYKPQIDAKLAEIRAIKASLTPDTQPQPPSSPVKPHYIAKADGSGFEMNIGFLTDEALESAKKPELDLFIYSEFDAIVGWTREDEDERSEPATKDMAERIEDALKTPYIGIYRQAAAVEPHAQEDGSFAPGGLRVEAMILELQAKAMVAYCDVYVVNSKDLVFTQRSEATRNEDIEAAAKIDLRKLMMVKLGDCFSQQTGGQFVFPPY